MRLRSKIFLSIIPIVGCALFLTGWLVIEYATKISHDAMYRYTQGILDAYITQDLTYRADILKKNKLDDVSSFVTRYQEEALASADQLNLIWPGHLFVINNQKQIIHCTDKEMSGQLPARWDPILETLLETSEHRMTGHLPWKEHESYVAQYFEPWDWIVVITIRGDFIHERERIVWLTVAGVGALASLVIIVCLGFLLNKIVLTPLGHLHDASERIAMEEEEILIPVKTKDELGELSRDIEGMSFRISQSRKSFQNAYDDLKLLDDMKTALIANVSHELRTPLTSILGFAKLSTKKLNKTMDSPTVANFRDCGSSVRDSLSIITDVGEDMAEMIDNIIMLMSLISEDTVAHKKPEDIISLVQGTCEPLRDKIESKGLSLTLDVPNGPINVALDRTMIESVITHLIDNAIFFTKEGGIGVEISVQDCEAVISIRDSGIGISEDEARRIFDQFFQAGDLLIEKPRGLGIGLPICQKIIELHEGRIWLESTPKVGSSFHFSLPLEQTA